MVVALFCITMAASAEERFHGDRHYVYRPGIGWVLPTIVGGVIVYEAIRPTQPGVVVVQPSPPVIVPPAPPMGYHWEAILDARCNCYKTVAVPN
jgi:hypothetical protein